MAGIQGINGIPEPTPECPATVRDRKRDDIRNAGQRDDVRISPEAKEAAGVQRLVDQAQKDAELRMDRVEAARASIERGDYRDLNVLREVARNLLKYLM